jgi:hypothetical protein
MLYELFVTPGVTRHGAFKAVLKCQSEPPRGLALVGCDEFALLVNAT